MWYDGGNGDEFATIEVISEGFQQPAGFITLKETAMEQKMSEQEIMRLRSAAKLASSLPEISTEIQHMDATVLGSAFKQIRDRTLTADQALSYLMELYSNHRLLKRMEQTAAEAANVTETRSNG